MTHTYMRNTSKYWMVVQVDDKKVISTELTKEDANTLAAEFAEKYPGQSYVVAKAETIFRAGAAVRIDL